MPPITLNVPDDLAERLRAHEPHFAQILELGLRELSAGRGFAGTAALLELLATLPAPISSCTAAKSSVSPFPPALPSVSCVSIAPIALESVKPW
jgi:hypothetical protein